MTLKVFTCYCNSRSCLHLLLFVCLLCFTWVPKFQISNWICNVDVWIFVWFLDSIVWGGSWIYLAHDFSCVYLWDTSVHVHIAKIKLMNSHLAGGGRFRVTFSKVTDESEKDLQYCTVCQMISFFFFLYHDQTESNLYYLFR